MKDPKYSELIAQYLSKDITVREQEQLMDWVNDSPVNKAFFDEMVEIWSLSERYEEPIAIDTDFAWQKIEEKLGDNVIDINAPKERGKVVGFRKVWWKVAAAIILLLSAGGYWWSVSTSITDTALVLIETKANEQKSHTLPDGSQIWLNESSSLSYEEEFEERILDLRGEAFFDVVKKDGQSFTIISGEARTTVLGTSFNVRAYPGESRIEVTVETGIVELEPTKTAAAKIRIEAGQSGFYDKPQERVELSEDPIINAQSWKTKKLSFKDDRMETVITAMERYFAVDIEVENDAILQCTFTGEFPDPKIEDLMENIIYILGLEFEQVDSTYYLSGAGCK